MSDVYFIIVPVVVVVVILNLCLIFWRVWLYQKRREQQMLYLRQQQHIARSQPSARVVRVERCLGPSGYAQRTSYAINQPGMPTRQLTRTVVIRPARDERADDPNLPPTYDQAVTGKDRSVLVEGGNQPPQGPAGVQNQGAPSVPPPPVATAPGPMPRFAPPPFSQVPRAQNNSTGSSRPVVGATQPSAPPGYSRNAPPPPQSAPAIGRGRSGSFEADDQTALLLGANN